MGRAVVAAVAMAALLPVAGASPATAQAAPVLRLVEQTAWSPPGGELRIRLAAEGAGAASAAGDLELAVTVYGRVTSRSAFTATLAGDQLGSPAALVTRPWSELDADGNGEVEVRLPLGDGEGGIGVGTIAGVHPVTVDLRPAGSGDPYLARLVTHLVVVPGADDESPPLLVALTLAFTAPPALGPDGTAAMSGDAAAALAATAAAIGAEPDVPLTLVPTPETVDALAGGTDTQVAVLDDLRGALDDRQVLGRPYVDVDVPAWVAAGLADPLRSELTRGTDVVADQLQVRPDARTWVADPTLTPAALSGLRDVGVDQVVVPDQALAPLDAAVFTRTLTAPFEVATDAGATMAAVAADGGLAAHFTAGDDPVLAAHQLLADLAVLFFDAPGTQRGVAVAAPRTWSPDPGFLATVLAALASPAAPVRAVVLDELFEDVAPATGGAGEPLVRALAPAEAHSSLAGYADRLRLTRLALAGYRSMAGGVNPRVDDLERRLLASGSEALTPEQRDAYVDAVVQAIDDQTAAVQVPEERTITITARQGRLPLTFRNDAGYPVEVAVQLDSDNKLEFPDGESFPLRLAEGTTRLEVVVRARTTGTSRVRVRLTSPDGILRVGDTGLTVRSTAVSGAGVVLSAGALLFLLVWWARHWRDTRRRRLVAPVGAEVEG